MESKKYQVFVSSTYSDLKEERRKILDILFMADCIPAGMEAFVATDDAQFEVIKKVIDLCDYYILIIGKRYGSVNSSTNCSYIEMEYDYAIRQGIPVLVFAIDEAAKLPKTKIEQNADHAEKLKAFREKALKNRLASIWTPGGDLGGKVAISIMKAKQEIPRPGWQRAVDFDEASLRRQIMDLHKDKDELARQLEFETREIEIPIQYKHGGQTNTRTFKLPELFEIVALEMTERAATEQEIVSALKKQLATLPLSDWLQFDDTQIVKKILFQLKKLQLIEQQRGADGTNVLWRLTSRGESVLDDLVLAKSAQT